MVESSIKFLEKINKIKISGDILLKLASDIYDRFDSLPLDAKPYDTDIMGFSSIWLSRNTPKNRAPLFGMALLLRYFAFSKIATELPPDQGQPIDDVRDYSIKESAIRAAAITPLLLDENARGLDVARFEKEDFLVNARRLAIEMAEEEEIGQA